jgi:peptide/nickel transport system ATP-binding protein
MKQPTNLIDVKDLTIAFPNQGTMTSVVDAISFAIRYGEILGVVGESGSGKSQTALSIMGLCPPSATISSENGIVFQPTPESKLVHLLSLPPKHLRKIRGKEISMIFQEPMTSLNPVHKCGKQVAEILEIHTICKRSQIKKRVLDLFHEVQLPDPQKMYNSYPHEISGGQRQRVMISMALACEPKLLIADEPTTALDVTVQKTILELLKQLQKKHRMSLLFITHDLGVISEISDRVLVMYKGKIVEEFLPADIPHGIKHPYTKGLIACKPPLHDRPTKLLTISDFMNESAVEITQTNSVANHEIIDKSDSDKEIILEIQNLHKYYPVGRKLNGQPKAYFKAVDNVSFSIFKGETLGLVGESGCGKTTLSRTLLNLIPPTSGQMIFANKDIAALRKKELKTFRQQAQIIFQDPYSSLNPMMTVGRTLMEPMQVHHIGKNNSERKEMAIQLLEKTGLTQSDFDKYPHQFSGGQRQRIVIARALALKPQFIICDEAVSALDVSVQAQVLNLLNDLKNEFQLTYLFISHDWSVVKYMSDRIMVMQKGKIVEAGCADEIFYQPQQEYTKTLINSIPGVQL